MLRHACSPIRWRWVGSSVYLLFLTLARGADEIDISVIQRSRDSISCRRVRFATKRRIRRDGNNNVVALDVGKHQNRCDRVFANDTVSGWTRSTPIQRRRSVRCTQLTMRRSFDDFSYLHRQHGSSEPPTRRLSFTLGQPFTFNENLTLLASSSNPAGVVESGTGSVSFQFRLLEADGETPVSIEVAPEPSTWTLLAFSGVVLVAQSFRRFRSR